MGWWRDFALQRLLIFTLSATRRDARVAWAIAKELNRRPYEVPEQTTVNAFGSVRQCVAAHLLNLASSRQGAGGRLMAHGPSPVPVPAAAQKELCSYMIANLAAHMPADIAAPACAALSPRPRPAPPRRGTDLSKITGLLPQPGPCQAAGQATQLPTPRNRRGAPDAS